MTSSYPRSSYFHFHHPHQIISKNTVPVIATWRITLAQCAPLPDCHHYLKWCSTSWSLYLMCLHLLPMLHQLYSTLARMVVFQMQYILSPLNRLQLITSESHVSKHSINSFRIWQIVLNFWHSTLYTQLSLTTKHGTDSPSDSLSWMPLLQFKKFISFLPTPLWESL